MKKRQYRGHLILCRIFFASRIGITHLHIRVNVQVRVHYRVKAANFLFVETCNVGPAQFKRLRAVNRRKHGHIDKYQPEYKSQANEGTCIYDKPWAESHFIV